MSENKTSSPDPDEIGETPWHALSRDDLASRLNVGDEGLDQDETARYQRRRAAARTAADGTVMRDAGCGNIDSQPVRAIAHRQDHS